MRDEQAIELLNNIKEETVARDSLTLVEQREI